MFVSRLKNKCKNSLLFLGDLNYIKIQRDYTNIVNYFINFDIWPLASISANVMRNGTITVIR